jgi:hypothetical protein
MHWVPVDGERSCGFNLYLCLRGIDGELARAAMRQPPAHHLFLHRHRRVAVGDEPRARGRRRLAFAVARDGYLATVDGQRIVHSRLPRGLALGRVTHRRQICSLKGKNRLQRNLRPAIRKEKVRGQRRIFVLALDGVSLFAECFGELMQRKRARLRRLLLRERTGSKSQRKDEGSNKPAGCPAGFREVDFQGQMNSPVRHLAACGRLERAARILERATSASGYLLVRA